MDRSLEDKVAIVTGAGSGMGQATARMLAAHGARVALCDINEQAVEEAAAQIGPAALAVACDVSDSGAVQRAVAATEDGLGPPSILYNAAGIDLAGDDGDMPAAGLSEQIFDVTIGVNLRGTYLMTKYAMPFLVAAGASSIINTASISGAVAGSNQHAYAASKGGVLGFTRALAYSYAQHGVRANTICPGIIRTPMIEFILNNDELRAKYIAGTPLGYLGEPDDIAHLVRYLASEESRFVTGAVITIDGGLTL